jgi:predicted metalloprotease
LLVLRARTWSHWRKKDFALAYVVAHEWGHHLQNVLGILRKSKLKSIQIELQADCLAGVWSYSTWARGLLEPGDILKAIRLARLVGDAPGIPNNDPNAHGSPSQRVAWFKRGYRSGKSAKCVVAPS